MYKWICVMLLCFSRVCTNQHGIIRKYGLNMCRQCFRQYANDIGFKKVSLCVHNTFFNKACLSVHLPSQHVTESGVQKINEEISPKFWTMTKILKSVSTLPYIMLLGLGFVRRKQGRLIHVIPFKGETEWYGVQSDKDLWTWNFDACKKSFHSVIQILWGGNNQKSHPPISCPMSKYG